MEHVLMRSHERGAGSSDVSSLIPHWSIDLSGFQQIAFSREHDFKLILLRGILKSAFETLWVKMLPTWLRKYRTSSSLAASRFHRSFTARLSHLERLR
jgi:hypothetical protein